MLFPAGMAWKVIMNLRDNSSAVDQLRKGKETKVKRSWWEVFTLIYGKNPTIIDFLLPTEYKE